MNLPNRLIKSASALLLTATVVMGGCMANDSAIDYKTEQTDKTEKTSASDGKWKVGYGCREIIPDGYDAESDGFDRTYYVAGYKNDNKATGILDPQCAHAAYLSDGRGNNIVMVSIDCVGISRADIAKIRERVSDVIEDCELTAVHVASTHTHAGIDTLGLWGPIGIDGKDDGFMEGLYEAANRAVRLACVNAREGRLYFGSADTGDLQHDSRLPEVYDANVYRIRFEADDGSGLQIVSYDAHAESLRSENTLVSADYPCYMSRKIGEATGDDCMFFAGAVGGLIMTRRLTDENGAEYPVTENVVRTGERLADCVLSISNERELEPALSSKTAVFNVRLDNQLFVAMSFAGVLSTQPVEGGGKYGLALETEVSLLKLGGGTSVNIALIPGEIFPELVIGGNLGVLSANPSAENPPTLRSLFDGELIVYGLCNDEIGYIVTPDDFLTDADAPCINEAVDGNGRKHYEETNSVGISAAWEIYNALELLNG